MLYTSAELVTLLQQARLLNHENLMGLPHTAERHQNMQDFHDRTFDFQVGDNTALEVKPTERRATEKYTTGIMSKPARVVRAKAASTIEYKASLEPSLSIDEEVAQMKQRGDTRSRDSLRNIVRNGRKIQR